VGEVLGAHHQRVGGGRRAIEEHARGEHQVIARPSLQLRRQTPVERDPSRDGAGQDRHPDDAE
jgi:hypothetical protein